MTYNIQTNEQVQILEESHDFEGEFAYVTSVAGDMNSLSEPIPDGWVEVRLANKFHELFREEHVLPREYIL